MAGFDQQITSLSLEVGTMTETNTITIQQDAQPHLLPKNRSFGYAGAMPLVMHRAGWSRLTFKTMSRTVSSSSSSLSSWNRAATALQNVFMIGGRPRTPRSLRSP